MKRTILFAVFALMLSLIATAEEKRILLKIQQGKPKQETGVNRAPLRVPVDVVYDTDTKEVTVVGFIETEVEVLLLNKTGDIEDNSDSINTTFTITSEGDHVIVIKTPTWVGEGIIEV